METTTAPDAAPTLAGPAPSRRDTARRAATQLLVAVTAIDLLVWFCVALGTGHAAEVWWVWPTLALGGVVGLLSYAGGSRT